MDLKPIVLVLAFFVFIVAVQDLASGQGAPDITCRITAGAPNADEKVLFTFQNSAGGTSNAHGARPSGDGAYVNKVVCNKFTSVSCSQSGVCGAAESGVLSFSNYTNAHVEPYGTGNYGWQSCGVAPDPSTGTNALTCVVRNTACLSFEGELVS